VEKNRGTYQEKRLIAPIEVKKEIEKGDDKLKNWVRSKKRNKMFIKPDSSQVEKVKEILSRFGFLSKSEKPDELSADPWLIALAAKNNEEEDKKNPLFQRECNYIYKKNYIVVTEESKRKPEKIPAVCNEIGIECINLIEMLEREKWEF
jgi:ribosomal protein S8